VWIGNNGLSHPANQALLITSVGGEIVISVGVDWFDGPEVSAEAPFQVSVQSPKLKPVD
jgi:hypothetical protein